MNPTDEQEWLVADGFGGFAMGTALGVRTRKYHGFYMGIAGRAETAYLVDFELFLNGRPFWSHRYESPNGAPVLSPDPLQAAHSFDFELLRGGAPRWNWEFEEGHLSMTVDAMPRGGIRLLWKWKAKGGGAKPAFLEIRPFWAMRPLHGMGGEPWSLNIQSQLATLSSDSGQEVFFRLKGDFQWKDAPLWYRQFHYSEEAARGYLAKEDLYSAGSFSVNLTQAQAGEASWEISEDPDVLTHIESEHHPSAAPRAASMDFVLHNPAGIVAGYPWFGEWGRDTFISLPGLAMNWIRTGGDPEEVWAWAQECLFRWGDWIRMTGMIPNLIEKGGSHQWESADGTLWWCHALASLWSFSLVRPELFPGIEERFGGLLATAVESISSGRHLFLTPNETGVLEVTEPHSTWMDARIEGAAVTPRTGVLPEINALWFQARCLQWMWSTRSTVEATEIEQLGRMTLSFPWKASEPDRPNTIFLHSIPLAPSFVLNDWPTLAAHLGEITENLWTPVGLRTLSPKNPAYQPRCIGDQTARDQAYHQGPPWAWLGGHYEMARHRLIEAGGPALREADVDIHPGGVLRGPILHHVPELFDAEPPFAARGAPAQAWSIATFEEAVSRRKAKVDAKLTQILAKRWLERLERAGNFREQESHP